MKEQIILSIPEPCHEDWNKMTLVEKGKHCAVCQKNVVDFTNDTDETIIEFFKNYNGNTCGRFSEEQLNRPLITYDLKPASKLLKYAAGLLLPFTFITSRSFAQKGKVAIAADTTKCFPKLNRLPGGILLDPETANTVTRIVVGRATSDYNQKKQFKDFVFITGKVVDANDGTPISGATISLESGKINTVTDSSGYFILHCKKLSHPGAITITSVGYQNAELDISSKNQKSGIIELKSILLSPDVKNLGEIVVAGYNYKRMGGLTGAVMIRRYSVYDTIKNVFKVSTIKVFPNPIAVNGTIQISFGNTSPGVYQIRLLSANGQMYYSFQKQISSPNETEQIHLNSKMSAGVYVLQIIDDKKRLVQTSKMVVQ